MSPEQLRAFLAANWPALHLPEGHGPAMITLDGLPPFEWIVCLDWSHTGKTLRAFRSQADRDWQKATKTGLNAAISASIDTLIAKHEGAIAKLRTAKEKSL